MTIPGFLGTLTQDETGALLIQVLELLPEDGLREALAEVPGNIRDTIQDILVDLEEQP